MEKELEYSELIQLSQQIQPHFLSNSINALLSLARLDRKQELIKAIEHLSLFLRYKYQNKQYLSQIRKELEYTKHYLAIQQLRYGKRLSIHYDIDDDLLDNSIPPYLIQTLVENAFKHGLEKKYGDMILKMILQTKNNQHHLIVQDNGPNWEETDQTKRKLGIGLQNIENRLNLLYQDQWKLELMRKDEYTWIECVWPMEKKKGDK